MTPQKFRTLVWKHFRTHGRHTLPWRTTRNPYRILISEVMLQQTQVERVIPYYTAWLKQFPDIAALAHAPLKDVLIRWQGLGYNRRAKMLHEAAKVIARTHKGKMPKAVEELEALPGIGPYTARAVAAFAYNQDVVLIETNIRTAVIHHFFKDINGIPDSEVLTVLTKAFPKGQARDWYAALMDYGAYLKRSGVRINAQSKGYAKQPAFKGSGREVRGAILRTLATGSATKPALQKLVTSDRKLQLEEQLVRMMSEGLIERQGTRFYLPT